MLCIQIHYESSTLSYFYNNKNLLRFQYLCHNLFENKQNVIIISLL